MNRHNPQNPKCMCTNCVKRRIGRLPPGVMDVAQLPPMPPWQWCLSYALLAIGDAANHWVETLTGGAPAAPAASEPAADTPGLRLVPADDPTARELADMEAQERGGGL